MKKFKYHEDYLNEKVKSTNIDSQLIKRLYHYLKPYRWLVVFSVFLLFITKAIETYVPILIGNVVQMIFDRKIPSEESLQSQILHSILFHCAWIILLLFLVYIFDCLNLVLRNWVGQKAIFSMRKEVYGHIMHLPVRIFDTNPIGRLISRAIHDIDQVDKFFSEGVVPMMGNILLFIGILLGMFWINWEVALGVCGIIPLLWLMTRRFRKQQRRCYELVRRIISAMNSFLQEAMMGNSIIRHFGLEKVEKKRFSQINGDYRNAQLETIYNFAFFFAAIDFLQNIVLIIAFVMLISLATPDKPFPAGTYFTFTLYAMMVFRPIGDLAERYNLLQSAITSSRRIFDILDQKSE